MKNANLNFFNLFVHVLSSRFRVQLNRERFGLIDHDLNKKHMENIWKIMLENQISKTIIARDFDQFFKPN